MNWHLPLLLLLLAAPLNWAMIGPGPVAKPMGIMSAQAAPLSVMIQNTSYTPEQIRQALAANFTPVELPFPLTTFVGGKHIDIYLETTHMGCLTTSSSRLESFSLSGCSSQFQPMTMTVTRAGLTSVIGQAQTGVSPAKAILKEYNSGGIKLQGNNFADQVMIGLANMAAVAAGWFA